MNLKMKHIWNIRFISHQLHAHIDDSVAGHVPCLQKLVRAFIAYVRLVYEARVLAARFRECGN